MKPCVWPLLTTFWSWVVIIRRNIWYPKITQLNLSCNFPSIDGSEVHFPMKSCVWPLLTTFWSLVVILRRNISYPKITQMNLWDNFPSIDGSKVHFSKKHYFWPYLTRCWSSLVTWSDQWKPFHWIRRYRIIGKHNPDTTFGGVLIKLNPFTLAFTDLE